jgi:hypothetical protein
MSECSPSQQSGRLTHGAGVKGGTDGEGGSRSTLRRLRVNRLKQAMTRRPGDGSRYSQTRDRVAPRLKMLLLGIALGLLIGALQARAHFKPGTEHNRRHAIVKAFCHSYKPCPLGAEALSVAYCESGPNLWPWARNGQYWGMFQFGSFARATYGFQWGPWAQARSAYRYWAEAGWSPWECA